MHNIQAKEIYFIYNMTKNIHKKDSIRRWRQENNMHVNYDYEL